MDSEMISWVHDISQLGYVAYVILLPLFTLVGAPLGIACGVFVSWGWLQPVPVVISYVVGALCRDVALYFGGRSGSSLLSMFPSGQRALKLRDVISVKVSENVEVFRRGYFWPVFCGKNIPVFSTPFVLFCGVLKLPLKHIYAPVVSAQVLWCGFVIWVGYYIGDIGTSANVFLYKATVIILILMMLMVAYNYFIKDTPLHRLVKSVQEA